MALDHHAIRFLLEVRRQGASLQRFAMIGRQTLRIDAGPLRRLLREAGFVLARAQVRNLLAAAGGFAEPLLRLLGADTIESVDASSYEGASIVHDLNLPIAETWKSRFTAVLDGGSLEHVFNFPGALRNCLEMVAVGGHYLAMSPGNNWMGHGFYQFSPETFFRVLTPDNGFEQTRVWVCETQPGAPWYEAKDPAIYGGRVKLVNRRPTALLIQARKCGPVPEQLVLPQQSDYATKWRAEGSRRRRRLLPLALREWIRRLRSLFRPTFSRKMYTRLPRG